ncbi:MAG: Rpn family recombination-promoting nuclease/putative transposase [Magnetococcales bacterium]|nr:Rpn family recombination-promoting nuclease/putative transposase [Magnetococcales bacterium]
MAVPEQPCLVDEAMIELAQPHDRLFKALMSDLGTAGALLREFLPKEIVTLLAPDDPEPVPGSFVSQELLPFYSDKLFRAKTLSGESIFVYTLMEHKSHPDRKVGWQLFRGYSRFMEQHEREHPDWTLLPAMISIVIYHGATEWQIPTEFSALLDADDALRPWLIQFRFILVDLGPIPDEQLARHVRLRAGLLALKYGTRDPVEQMVAMETITSALMAAPELLVPIMRYLLTTFHKLDESVARDIVVRVHPRETMPMLSIFARNIIEQHKDAWIREGELQGRQAGELEGEARILIRQLQRRFGTIPGWARLRITEEGDPQTLEEWSLRVLDARSLDEVFTGRM